MSERTWVRGEIKLINDKCPCCTVSSAIVCPSIFWTDDKDEKIKLINDYIKSINYVNSDDITGNRSETENMNNRYTRNSPVNPDDVRGNRNEFRNTQHLNISNNEVEIMNYYNSAITFSNTCAIHSRCRLSHSATNHVQTAVPYSPFFPSGSFVIMDAPAVFAPTICPLQVFSAVPVSPQVFSALTHQPAHCCQRIHRPHGTQQPQDRS